MKSSINNLRSVIYLAELLVLLNAVGLLLELLLIDHFENSKQMVPIISLSGVIVFGLVTTLKISERLDKLYKPWMILTITAGILGLIFHAYGNYEFAIEMYPRGSNYQLFLKTVRGATPLLAPGAMIGLGLLGLLKNHIQKLNKQI